MKKNFLLTTLCILLILYSQIVFGKCNATLHYQYLPEGDSGYAPIGTSTMLISPGETIRFTFWWSGVCDAGTQTSNITDTGLYNFSDPYQCVCPWFDVRINYSTTTGIN